MFILEQFSFRNRGSRLQLYLPLPLPPPHQSSLPPLPQPFSLPPTPKRRRPLQVVYPTLYLCSTGRQMLVLDNSFMNPHIRLLVVRSVDWLFCLSYIISLHIHAPIRVLVLNRFLQTMSHFHFFANMDEKKNPNVPINICIF